VTAGQVSERAREAPRDGTRGETLFQSRILIDRLPAWLDGGSTPAYHIISYMVDVLNSVSQGPSTAMP
jgi:hypothetical protein